MLDSDYLDSAAAAFSVLGSFHQQPPDAPALEQFWQLLADWPLPATPQAEAGTALMRESQRVGEDAGSIRDDHARLYGAWAVAKVSPYESVQRGKDRLVFDAHTLQVREFYRALSLEAPRLNREPDDHLGLELDFIARSCLRSLDALEQGSTADAQRYFRIGAEFLAQHLLPWAPTVLYEVVDQAQTRFMRGLAQLSLGALADHARATGAELPATAGGPPGS